MVAKAKKKATRWSQLASFLGCKESTVKGWASLLLCILVIVVFALLYFLK